MAATRFTAAEIRRLLGLLEDELAKQGTAASMYIVGGAAIALSYDTDRTTKDIDATLVPEDVVLRAAKVVADAEHLPPDWLNTEATPWVPPHDEVGRREPPGSGLRIDVASPEALLAMKLVASRNRDIPDIKLLAEAIGTTGAVQLADLVREQYGADQLEAVHGGYADMLLWCQTLTRQLWPD